MVNAELGGVVNAAVGQSSCWSDKDAVLRVFERIEGVVVGQRAVIQDPEPVAHRLLDAVRCLGVT